MRFTMHTNSVEHMVLEYASLQWLLRWHQCTQLGTIAEHPKLKSGPPFPIVRRNIQITFSCIHTYISNTRHKHTAGMLHARTFYYTFEMKTVTKCNGIFGVGIVHFNLYIYIVLVVQAFVRIECQSQINIAHWINWMQNALCFQL